MSFFKTLINVGMNTSNDQKVPAFITEKLNKEKVNIVIIYFIRLFKLIHELIPTNYHFL
jgi:hypothetical protein